MSRQDRSKNSNLSNVFKLIPIRLLFPIHFMFLLQLYLFFSLHLSSVALYSVFYTGCSTHFCIVVKCTYCFFFFLILNRHRGYDLRLIPTLLCFACCAYINLNSSNASICFSCNDHAMQIHHPTTNGRTSEIMEYQQVRLTATKV